MSRRLRWMGFLLLGCLVTQIHADPAIRRKAEAVLEQAIANYRAVELDKAEKRLLEALDSLKPIEAGDPQAQHLAARVHLQLGRVAVVAGKPEKAREHFRQALRREPDLEVTAQSDPPKILRLFEAVRTEMAPPEDELPRAASGQNGTGSVLFEARLAYEAGLASLGNLELAAAQAHFRRALARLKSAEDASPEVRALAARAHLQLGRSLAVGGKLDEAREEFEEALHRERSLNLNAKLDPPKVLALFESVKAGVPPEVVPQLPGIIGWQELALAALVVVLLIFLVFNRRRRRKQPAPLKTIELEGHWNLTTTLVSNNVGVPNGETNTESIHLRQEGNRVSILDEQGGALFQATIEGNNLVFTGKTLDAEEGRQFARSYSGNGTVSPTLIAGTLQMAVSHDLQNYGFQFQSNTTYNYNLTMTRL